MDKNEYELLVGVDNFSQLTMSYPIRSRIQEFGMQNEVLEGISVKIFLRFA